MNCPVCKLKLKCQDSRQENDNSCWREYKCKKCNNVYLSEEKLIPGAINEEIYKSLKNRK